MRFTLRLGFCMAILAAGNAVAADMLPLKQGIYVPVGSACKGASRAEIVNYWGGRSSIGTGQVECRIKSLVRKGTAFTIVDRCRDLQSGGMYDGDPTTINIASPTRFQMGGTSYRYCGQRVEF